MTILLCRPTLSLTSGAGQLMRLQAEGLEARGERVELRCRRGAFAFFLKTGHRARRATARELQTLAASSASHLLVDHGMRLPFADVVFVHNLLSEAVLHLERDDWRAEAAEEAIFFGALNPEALVVANSNLVRRALLEHFGLDPARVVVELPGFDSFRFGRASYKLRAAARRALGVAESAPLVGFVTSGDFRKRGLDLFLEAAEAIVAARPDAKFFVVGSKRLPSWASQHSLFRSARLLYRPKTARPERWFAALDVFLYPARFEEFGLVVLEALALGIPVLTSRQVGASECMPAGYGPWVLDAPEPAAFADRALALLEDAELRGRLGELGAASVAGLDERRYVHATVDLILERKRTKAGPDSARRRS